MKCVSIAGPILLLMSCQQPPAGTESAVYTGLYRKGFEQSDFYLSRSGACGPWWVTIESEEDFLQLETHARGEGCGRAVVVRMTVEAEQRGPVDFGFRPRFEDSLNVTGIVSAEPVSDETFSAATEAARACGGEEE